MSEGESGKEQIAEQLQQQLTEFAQESDVKKIEEKLPPLVRLIKDVATIEVVSVLTDRTHQRQLEQHVKDTFNTQFVVDGKRVDVWGRWGAIVQMGEHGLIHAAVYFPNPALASYGDLTRYALIKAVCQLELAKVGRKGGIEDVNNFDYLTRLGLKPFDDLFPGSAVTSDGSIYLGASGCNPKPEYLSGLLGGATPTGDTQSSRFDRIFCGITAAYLYGRAPRGYILEPRELQELRINN